MPTRAASAPKIARTASRRRRRSGSVRPLHPLLRTLCALCSRHAQPRTAARIEDCGGPSPAICQAKTRNGSTCMVVIPESASIEGMARCGRRGPGFVGATFRPPDFRRSVRPSFVTSGRDLGQKIRAGRSSSRSGAAAAAAFSSARVAFLAAVHQAGARSDDVPRTDGRTGERAAGARDNGATDEAPPILNPVHGPCY